MSLDNSYRMRGLIHLAAVLDDATLPKLTRRQISRWQRYSAENICLCHKRGCMARLLEGLSIIAVS